MLTALGISGSRSGFINKSQKYFCQEIMKFLAPKEFHHGDCVGVDAEGHDIAKSLGCHIIIHPPIKTELRAYKVGDETRKPKSYFDRNRNIVEESDMLIAFPYTDNQSNGGTWYTAKYAMKIGKPAVILSKKLYWENFDETLKTTFLDQFFEKLEANKCSL